jgi:hypothetical protein
MRPIRVTIRPIQKLQTSIRMIPTITSIPPTLIPPIMLPSRRNPAIVTTPPYPVRAGATLPSEAYFRLGWGCAARPELLAETRPLHELSHARLRHEVAVLHEHLAAQEYGGRTMTG